MHLRGQRFTCSADGPSTKNIERIRNIKETGDSRYLYQSKLDKACFHKDMPDRDVKDLNRKMFPDNVLNDKTFILLNIPNFLDISVDLLQCSINFLIKKCLVEQFKMKQFLIKTQLMNYAN